MQMMPWDIARQRRVGPKPLLEEPDDPAKVQEQQFRANSDARAAEAEQRAREAEVRAREIEARNRLEWDATHNPDGSKKPDPSNATVDERTAAFLATRLKGGVVDINNALKGHPGEEKPSIWSSVAGIFGDDARNAANSPTRQRIEAAQRDVLDSALTLGTGAAYTPEQLEGYRRSYFPQLGDDSATVADKQLRLRRVIEAARIKAGASAPMIDEALAAIGDQQASPPEQTVGGFGLQEQPKLPGAEDYRSSLYAAMKGGQIGSYKDALAFTEQFNQQHGTHIAPPVNDKGFFNAIAAARKGKAFNIELPQYDARVQQAIEEKAKGKGAGAAFKHGVKDALSLGAGDEISGAVNALGQSLRGEGSFGDLYGVNSQAERGYNDYLQRDHPAAYLGGQFAGGMAMPTFGAQTPLELARLGAGIGGIYGAASASGGVADRINGGLTGGALGGATGFLIPELMGAGSMGAKLAERNSAITNATEDAAAKARQIEAAKAAQDLKIDMPRFVAGGPTAHMLGAMADRSQVAAPTMQRATNKMLDQAEAARNNIAAATGGRMMDPEGMGEAAARGGKAGRLQEKGRYQRLYQAAEGLSHGAAVPLPGAKQAALAQVQELANTPGGMDPKILGTFQDMAAKMDGQWSPEAVRRMRTQIRERLVQSGADINDASRRANIISDAAEQDMVNGLRAQGRGDAATAWQMASRERAAYQQTKEQVFDPILGARREKSPSEVASALRSAVRNNPARVRKFIAAMPEDEANDVRASMIGQMGRASNGRQDAEGEAFSLDTFLTHWNELKGVREHVFDPQTVGALNKLAKVAQRAKETGRVSNTSHTGSISIGLMTAGPAASAPLALFSGHPGPAAGAVLTSIGMGLAQHFGAKLLASPNFARRLAQTPMNNPASAAKFWSSEKMIGNLIRSEPTMAEEIKLFQRAVNDNLQRQAAASPDPNEEQRQQQPY